MSSSRPRTNPGITLFVPSVIGIGIDVGMTYTGAAACYPIEGSSSAVDLIPTSGQQSIGKFPSKVLKSRREGRVEIVVGENAVPHPGTANKLHELFKWSLRRNAADPLDPSVTPSYLTEQLIRAVREDVNHYLEVNHWDEAHARRLGIDAPRIRYAFGFPGMWNDDYKGHFNDAIKAAGFASGEYELIEEPLASIIGAMHALNDRSTFRDADRILVCDIGGGTVDLAVVATGQAGVLEAVAATLGNAEFGMSNLDKALALLIAKRSGTPALDSDAEAVIQHHLLRGDQFNRAWSNFSSDSLGTKSSLLAHAEYLKRELCTYWHDPIRVTWLVRFPREVRLTRTDVQPLLSSMFSCLERDVRDYLQDVAGNGMVPSNSITHILISGGGSKLPGIREAFAASISLEPDRVISHVSTIHRQQGFGVALDTTACLVQYGASLFAYDPELIQARRSNATYGIAVCMPVPEGTPPGKHLIEGKWNGKLALFENRFEPFIRRHEIIDVTGIERRYRPRDPDKPDVIIEVYQETSGEMGKNRKKGDLTLSLPEDTAAKCIIYVRFYLGGDRLLHARARYCMPHGDEVLSDELIINWTNDVGE